MELRVIEGGVGCVDDGVMVRAQESKVFHAVRATTRAIPYVVGLGGVHGVNRGAVEAAELAAPSVKAVQICDQLAVARGGPEEFGFSWRGISERFVFENEWKLGRFCGQGSF
jgi:hypothetical protein